MCNNEIEFDEVEISEDDQKAAKEEALRIMTEGDPLALMLETIKERHIGDDILQKALCVSIAGQSCNNTNGIQIAVNGQPGSGKSHGIKIHLHLIRSRHKIEATLSPKALFYADLKPGIIVFSDDTEPVEALEQTIKIATTNYQEETTHLTVKDQNSLTLVIPPRINWLFTSVDSTSSAQLLSRQFKYNTSETQEQKDAITAKQRQEAATGRHGLTDVDMKVLICRYMYDLIKSKMFKVKIPYSEKIKFHDNRDSRNISMFFDMIKGFAILYHMQREMDEEGALLADESDFCRAEELFDSQLASSVTKLSERERLVLYYIANHDHCTISHIALATGIPEQSVRNIINGRSDRVGEGLRSKIKGLTVSRESHSYEKEDGGSVSKTQDYYTIAEFDGLWALFESGFATLGGDTP